ncbi:MAG: NAD-dependent succinate-semialdehyde dehydrogenase [Mesorhizobium sp.]|uniref:NAD-dependent succinate-semialdehyde dehydrogenase n=1 Tax=Mesorhizobium sp. TaxID=1871066 RepID=UPI001AD33F0C|nr:NAD-dependent succinate-semialdehyde dehydrogenase [Mesorhizobium sp.]MBN9217286.1 NAD-dependent succinate-semialdehyde dehydrogenase [Mesorhizobium sp.]
MAVASSLLDRLADKTLIREAGAVAGAWLGAADSSATFDVHNPATGERLATLPDCGVGEIRRAIETAHAAQKTWAALAARDRAGKLRRLHDLIMTNQSDLAAILTAEMGKPLTEAKGEIAYGAGYIEWYAEEAKRVYGDVIPGHQPDKRIVVLRQPAAETPLSALALAALAERAGIPLALFSVVPTTGAATFGREVCANDLVRKLTFTGSTQVGRKLIAQAAEKVLRLSMELGGNAPFIVFDDADLEAAVEGAMQSKYRNAGQTCVCANRIYVQAGIHDAFVARLTERVASLEVGDGFAPSVAIGPLINEKAVGKWQEHLDDAVGKGARVVAGGQRHSLGGTFVEPTVLTGVTSTMLVAREETFAPLAPIFRFETTEEVVRLANDTEFGLAAYFFARDLSQIWKIAEALEYGMVGVNTGLISTEVAPFGGVKQSGFGREGSRHGLDDYLTMKYVCLGAIA